MEISEGVLKLIMSKTKRDILKSLLERRKMLSEISADLDLSLPTIKEHLSSLEKGELIVKLDDGHKWKYYELTRKGRGIVSEAKPKFTFTLTFVIPIFLMISGVLIGMLPGGEISTAQMEAKTATTMAGAVAETVNETVVPPVQTNNFEILSYALIIAGITMFLMLLIKIKREKKK